MKLISFCLLLFSTLSFAQGSTKPNDGPSKFNCDSFTGKVSFKDEGAGFSSESLTDSYGVQYVIFSSAKNGYDVSSNYLRNRGYVDGQTVTIQAFKTSGNYSVPGSLDLNCQPK